MSLTLLNSITWESIPVKGGDRLGRYDVEEKWLDDAHREITKKIMEITDRIKQLEQEKNYNQTQYAAVARLRFSANPQGKPDEAQQEMIKEGEERLKKFRADTVIDAEIEKLNQEIKDQEKLFNETPFYKEDIVLQRPFIYVNPSTGITIRGDAGQPTTKEGKYWLYDNSKEVNRNSRVEVDENFVPIRVIKKVVSSETDGHLITVIQNVKILNELPKPTKLVPKSSPIKPMKTRTCPACKTEGIYFELKQCPVCRTILDPDLLPKATITGKKPEKRAKIFGVF